MFTVTHGKTGLCIDVQEKTIFSAKNKGEDFLKSKGEALVRKTMRKAKVTILKSKIRGLKIIPNMLRVFRFLFGLYSVLLLPWQ